MNSSQLASYDVFKRALLSVKGSRDGPVLQFGASFLAGTVATSKFKSITVSKNLHIDCWFVSYLCTGRCRQVQGNGCEGRCQYTIYHYKCGKTGGFEVLLPWLDRGLVSLFLQNFTLRRKP
jgi:hypothetical protein